MAQPDAEKLEAEAVELLKELGLTEYESHTLVNLFRLGTATAKEIADMNSVPRTRVYDAVDSLHDLGLVDIQYTSPRKFTPVSRDTAVHKLRLSHENTITELSETIDQLEPVERQTEEFGVWTVSSREAVSSRVFEFVDDAEEQVIYMTVDELLTDEHIDRLRAAEQRGVDIYIAGISEAVRDRIQAAIPSTTVFETLWEWSDIGAGSLLITDERTALVSVLHDADGEEFEEVAIWGTGERNSLVVVLRAIFTWRLGADDYVSLPE
jgi:sugar-specific transcriptional regulator TrmB